MRTLKFVHLEPKTMSQACDYLEEWGSKGQVMAGGTALLSHWGCRNFGLHCFRKTSQPKIFRCFGNPKKPNALINIKRIKGLDRIEANSKFLKVGSLATLNALKETSFLNDGLEFLREAIDYVGAEEIRNLATVGGNISTLAPGSGIVPSLLCLNSRVRIASKEGREVAPLRDFFDGKGDGGHCFPAGKILLGIEIPHLPKNAGGGFCRLNVMQSHMSLTIASAATVVWVSAKNGHCVECRIVIGNAKPGPYWSSEADSFLLGKPLNEETIRRAGELAVKKLKPISDGKGSAEYRREVAYVMVRRALKVAAKKVLHSG